MIESEKQKAELEERYDTKLKTHGLSHEDEIIGNEIQFKEKEKSLNSDYERLKDTQVLRQRELDEIKKERTLRKGEYQEAQRARKDKIAEIEQRDTQIEMLENENSLVIEKLKKRATDLYKYKFKIKDLRKSKHVLTHRTQEMKASLEPKNKQIDNLQN